MTDVVISDSTVTSIDNPVAQVEIVTVAIPGIIGPQGPTGNPGPPNVLSVGTVTTSAAGGSASATITGISPSQTLNLVLPQGAQGPQGNTGPPPTLSVGTVTTGAAGSGAAVSLDSTNAPAYVLSFTIPQGANGGGVIVGGAVGDVLMKNSTTDFDTKWSTPTSAPTASTLMERDANGRAQVVDPAAAADIATKNYADTKVSVGGDLGGTAASPQVTSGTHHTHTSSQISDAASAATASKVIIRDANGRASVVDPAVSTDISTKNYTDTQVATKAAIAGDLGGTAAAPTVTGGTHHTHTSSQISDSTNLPTASMMVRRDSNGRAQVADPVASSDIATKNYADTTTAIHPKNAWSSASTGSSPGSWYKIGTVTISAQFIESSTTWLLVSGGGANNQEGQARLAFRVRQNAALGSAPLQALILGDVRPPAGNSTLLTTANFMTIIEENDAAATKVSVWLRADEAQATWYAFETSATGGTSIAYAGYSVVGVATASLPAGTQTNASLAPNDTLLNAATSVSTASTIVERDANGRASVLDPSASTDISTKNYTDTQDAAMRRPALNTQTASYTLVLTDERKLVQINSASSTTLTVPPNSSVAFPIGAIVDVQMLGAGTVTISPGAGVTFESPSSILVMSRQYAIVRLQKVATDTWVTAHAGVSSATSASTANAFMIRDASGRASVADPSASTDIATKNYVDTKVPGKITVGTTAPSSPSVNDIWIDTN